MAATSFDVRPTGITVSLPSVMQSATGGRREIELCSGTVEQALEGLIEAFPDLSPRLLTEENQIHRFVNVYLDDEDVRFLQGLNTPVLPGQRLTILSAIAGG
jgi:molybdopterin synthase sulfur carrier subunit